MIIAKSPLCSCIFCYKFSASSTLIFSTTLASMVLESLSWTPSSSSLVGSILSYAKHLRAFTESLSCYDFVTQLQSRYCLHGLFVLFFELKNDALFLDQQLQHLFDLFNYLNGFLGLDFRGLLLLHGFFPFKPQERFLNFLVVHASTLKC